MRKASIFLVIVLCLTLFTACGDTEKVYTAEDVAGRMYTYEKDGAGGPFTISIYEDGSFQYYEGMFSSHIGMGTWTLEGNDRLCIKEQEMGRVNFNEDGTMDMDMEMYVRTNWFKVEKDCLVWIEESSDNFLYVKAEDGDRFYGAAIPEKTPVTLERIAEIIDAAELLDDPATEEMLTEMLEGLHHETLAEAWGERDGTLSGFWGDIWELDAITDIIVYYDQDGYVNNVRIMKD